MSEILASGEIAIIGRHPAASNAVFLVEVSLAAQITRAIYKPVAGERALWDFPDGNLARHEVAASVLDTALGMGHVPRTVWREDAPHGAGSLQQWIEDATIEDVAIQTELSDGWLHVLDAELQDGTDVVVAHRDRPDLRTVALFDALMNNGDRKAGHLLRDPAGALWAVDHGVAFHPDPKLRTVLWGFAGQAIDEPLTQRLQGVASALDALSQWLDPAEIAALQLRTQSLMHQGVFPHPSGEWPSIPWPIY
jgi:uncharacterized repeat protein (TIGR03843 family)